MFKRNKTHLLLFLFLLFSLVLVFAEEIKGYTLESKNFIKDIGSDLYIYKHIDTKTTIIAIPNNDIQKYFSITFRTPAVDDTGVNHILEHSVFAGSKNYPVKDLFSIISKNYLTKDFNAYTSVDNTYYPFSAKNDKEYINLMKIYLDAVFFPNIYKSKFPFMQEGWRYEIENEKSDLKINGVVYNEMKGSYSAKYTILNTANFKSLFPDSSYGFDSGGIPKYTPALSYKKLLETHKKYYNPCNSMIFLYGKIDVMNILKIIDESYLSQIKNNADEASFVLQKPFSKTNTYTEKYSVSNEEDMKKSTYISYNLAAGDIKNTEDSAGLTILADLLFNNSNSPIRNIVFQNLSCSNLGATYHNYLQQPFMEISFEGCEEKSKNDIEKIIKNAFTTISEEGLDHSSIMAKLSNYEFHQKQLKNRSDKGSHFYEKIKLSWLYGLNPELYLFESDTIKNIRSKVESGYFENLIKKYLINNSHSSIVVLKPSLNLDIKNREVLSKELKSYKNKLSKKELASLIDEYNNFKKWQDSKDSDKARNTIPVLSLTDIATRVEKHETTKEEFEGITLLHNKLDTNGISYVKMYFNGKSIPQNDVRYLKILSDSMTLLSSKKYKYTELLLQKKKFLGNLALETSIGSYRNNKEKYVLAPYLNISFSCLDENIEKSMELIGEFALNTQITSDSDLNAVLYNSLDDIKEKIYSDLPGITKRHLKSTLTNGGKFREELFGIGYYDFIKELYDSSENKYNEITKKLSSISRYILNKNVLTVSFTGSNNQYEKFKELLAEFIDSLETKKYPAVTYTFELNKKNDGLGFDSNVQYVYMAGNYVNEGFEYSGKMSVITKIIRENYLWPYIREKGGAYGAELDIDGSTLIFSSYRDPKLSETLKVFKRVPEFLKTYKPSNAEIKNYIIATLGDFEDISDVESIIDTLDSNYFNGSTLEDTETLKAEIISTKPEDLKEYITLFEKIIKQNKYCISGNKKSLEQNSKLFGNIRNF